MSVLSKTISIGLLAASIVGPVYSQNTNNTNKFWIPREYVVFSSRFVDANEVDCSPKARPPNSRMNTADNWNADAIVWHYPNDFDPTFPTQTQFDDRLIDIAQSRNYLTIQCALPVITREPAAACLDANNNPIETAFSSPAARQYRPDTTRTAFRLEVLDYINNAYNEGCTSFHQDDPNFMVTRQPDGCYQTTATSTVEGWVDNYYVWLKGQLQSKYGTLPPMSYNKKFATDERNNNVNYLAKHFNTAFAEADLQYNRPEYLYDAILNVNNLIYNITSMTTLVDKGIDENKKHIAAVYALSGHPVVPWDVYLGDPNGFPCSNGNTQLRYYGSPNTYGDYFDLVKNNAPLFNGMGVEDVYVNYDVNGTDTEILHLGNLTGVSDRTEVMAVLKGDLGNTKQVLHVVNWDLNRPIDYYTFWIKKSALPFTPTQAIVRLPGQPNYTTPVVDGGFDRWKVTIGNVDVWAVAELKP